MFCPTCGKEYFENQKDKIIELENQSKKDENMMDEILRNGLYNNTLNPDDLFHSSDVMEELEEEYATFTYNGVTYSVDSTGYCQQVETTGNVILGNISKKTLEEIGNIYGVTKECIRQTELRALKKLRVNAADTLVSYLQ